MQERNFNKHQKKNSFSSVQNTKKLKGLDEKATSQIDRGVLQTSLVICEVIR